MQHEPNLSRASVSGAANEASNVHSLDMPDAGGREEGTGDNPAEVRGGGIQGSTNPMPRTLEATSNAQLIYDYDQLCDDYSFLLVELADTLLHAHTEDHIRSLLTDYEKYLPVRVLDEIKAALNERLQGVRESQKALWGSTNG